MAKPLLILARAGKRWHRQTALADVIVMSCIALPVSSSISFAQTQFVIVPATIQAFFSTDLYAKNSGYISQVNNDIGDHVKRGQVLAVIEDPELQAQFDKAQAAVQQTEAALEVAKRQLAGMQADLTLQQVTLKRQKELFAGKAVTAQALDEAQAKEGVSNANVGMRKQRLDWPRRNSRPLKPKLPSSSRFCNMTRLWRHTTVS